MSDIERWFGCPRNSGTFSTDSDAEFARREVTNGLIGWQYDICCHKTSDDLRQQLTSIGYCDPWLCQYNPGADFCIVSPVHACRDSDSDEILRVSNQCCYNSDGDLIQEQSEGAGSLDREVSGLHNILQHFNSELLPYQLCCLDGFVDNDATGGCELYEELRPSVIGSYWSRRIVFAVTDPHLETVDGAQYTFNGLGVYVMVSARLGDEETLMQVSTRLLGGGTVFSGFAITHSDGTKLEAFISQSGAFEVIINNNLVTLHHLSSITVDNVMIMEKSLENFIFHFRPSDLIVQVLITDGFLNLFTSVPPTFHSNMQGLLGFYDGNSENDFLASGNVKIDAFG